MTTIDKLRARVKACIIKALELEITPEDIADDASLFRPSEQGGLGLDSLAALEIIVALSQEFNFMVVDVNPEVFETIDTLAQFVLSQSEAEQIGKRATE